MHITFLFFYLFLIIHNSYYTHKCYTLTGGVIIGMEYKKNNGRVWVCVCIYGRIVFVNNHIHHVTIFYYYGYTQF